MKRARYAMLVLLAAATAANATDIPIVGLKLIMVDKTAVGGGAKAVFVAKDTNIVKGTGTDPGNIFADMGVSYDGNSGTFGMPGGADWLVNKTTVAKFVNNAAPTGSSIKVSVIKPGSLIKAVAKSLGEDPIDISTAPSGTVYASYAVANGGEVNRFCTQFGTCVHKLIAGGTGYKLVCKGNSSGDPTCSGAPKQCCTIPSFTFCGYLDPVLCGAQNGMPGALDSVCDSVTGSCQPSASAGNCCANVPTAEGDICIAGPSVSSGICSGQGGTHTASGVCQPDASCN